MVEFFCVILSPRWWRIFENCYCPSGGGFCCNFFIMQVVEDGCKERVRTWAKSVFTVDTSKPTRSAKNTWPKYFPEVGNFLFLNIGNHELPISPYIVCCMYQAADCGHKGEGHWQIKASLQGGSRQGLLQLKISPTLKLENNSLFSLFLPP